MKEHKPLPEFNAKLCCLFEKKYRTRDEVHSHLKPVKGYGYITHGGPFDCERSIYRCEDCGAVFILQELEEYVGPCGNSFIEDSYYNDYHQVNSLEEAYELCETRSGIELDGLAPRITERIYKSDRYLQYDAPGEETVRFDNPFRR